MSPSSAPWVRDLRPSDPHLIDHTCDSQTWNSAVNQIGVGPASWVAELSRGLAKLAAAMESDLADSDRATERMRPTCEAVVLHALQSLDEGSHAPHELPRETIEQLIIAVRRRIPLPRLLDAQRAAHAMFSDTLVDEFHRLVPAGSRLAYSSKLSHFLVDHVSAISSATTVTYLDEEKAWLSGAEGTRADHIRSLLRGDRPPRNISATVGYEIADRSHIGIVLRPLSAVPAHDEAGFASAARSLFERVGVYRYLIVDAGADEIWAWGSGSGAEARALASLEPVAGAIVSIGSPAIGLVGFRRTYEDAIAALRVADLKRTDARQGARSGAIILFRDVQLLALLTADPATAGRFARDELGQLGQRGEEALRETVRIYLECNGSPAAAATRLMVAKNTVSYRLKRAEQLLGRSVRERPYDLWSALCIVEMIGTTPPSTMRR